MPHTEESELRRREECREVSERRLSFTHTGCPLAARTLSLRPQRSLVFSEISDEVEKNQHESCALETDLEIAQLESALLVGL